MNGRYDSNPTAATEAKWIPVLVDSQGRIVLGATTNLIGKMGIDQATANANEVVVKSITAGANLLGKVGIDQTTPGTTNAVYAAPAPQTPVIYRSAVTAADVVAAPGTVTCTKLTGVGALTAGTYYVKVVAGNAHGRTTAKAGDTSVTTETTNLGIRAAFAAVTGAAYYDIYCSTATNPLFAGRITEAQRASGIIIDAVNSTAAGGTAGAVDIYPIGTGLAADTAAAQNTAYVVPASPIACTGFTYCDFDILCSRTGDIASPSLTLCPFLYNSVDTGYAAGQTIAPLFGGASGVLGSLRQRIRVEVRGNSQVALLVQSIAGTGMSVDMYYTLS